MKNIFPDISNLTSYNITASDVLENTFDSIFVKTIPDLMPLYINKEPTERMFGYSISEFFNKSVQCIYSKDQYLYDEMIQECITLGASQRRLRCQRKNGDIIWVLYKIRSIKNSDNVTNAILGSCVEVTKLVKTEQKVVCASRLSSMLQISNGIAHEINNPLAALTLGVEKLKRVFKKEESADPKLSSLFQMLENSIERISLIIIGLRNFSRDPDFETVTSVTVGEILAEIQMFIINKFKNSGVSFAFEHNGLDTLKIQLKKYQTIHALLNLITNSYEAVENLESKWVRIEVAKNDTDLTFSVIDSGGGINDDIVDRVMEPFFTTKDIGQGAGLGLSISSGIASEYGGRLDYVKNSNNTQFNYVLPLK